MSANIDWESLRTVGVSLLGSLLGVVSGLIFLFAAFAAVTLESRDFRGPYSQVEPVLEALESDLLNLASEPQPTSESTDSFTLAIFDDSPGGSARILYEIRPISGDVYRQVSDLSQESEEEGPQIQKLGRVSGLEFQIQPGYIELRWPDRGIVRTQTMATKRGFR